LAPDLVVVAAFGLILPAAVLAIPRLGCVNIHASLLPRWRGAAPIQRAIEHGDAETGVTIMLMDEGLDTGPMIHRLGCPIESRDTGGSLHDRLAALGARALIESLPWIETGHPRLEPQDPTKATYAKKLRKEEALVDWRRPAVEIERRVRAFDPWPIAHTRLRGDPLRVWGAEVVPGTAEPGRVVGCGTTGFDVGTGAGLLRITRVQLAGKRVMTAAEFLNAHDPRGAALG
jgi:methionyl-tRNA formyltransferase